MVCKVSNWYEDIVQLGVTLSQLFVNLVIGMKTLFSYVDYVVVVAILLKTQNYYKGGKVLRQLFAM